jgi:hypothetical protein
VSGGNGIIASFGVSFTVYAEGEGPEPDPVYSIVLDRTGELAFPEVEVGYSPAPTLTVTVTVTNNGNQATGQLTAALSGDNAGSFTITGSPINSIAANQIDTFSVGPNTGLGAATYTATVTVTGGNGITANFNVSFTVNTAGEGPDPDPVYSIELDKTGTYPFTEVNALYVPITPLTVTVTNTGNQATGELIAALSGTDAGNFTITDSPINSIAVEQTATFSVGPDTDLAEGTYTATVTVSGGNGIIASFGVSFTVNAAQPYSIALSVGETHTFAPAAPGYGAIDPLTVTVTNNGTQPTGELTAALSGTGAGNFTLTGSPIAGIAVGGTASFTVRPNTGLAGGTYTATVTVSSTDGSAAQSFGISFTVHKWYTAITDIAAYLGAAGGGASADDPVLLWANISFPGEWGSLLFAIQNAGKFVALDISLSAMTGGAEFHPGTANTGEAFITALTLPCAAQSIRDSEVFGDNGFPIENNPAFRYFTALREASGANIKTIGHQAFEGCTGLTTADFPLVTSIADGAFYGCTGLTMVSFPAVTSIGRHAFRGCTSLTTVSLPATLLSVSSDVFTYCTSLTAITVDANNPNYSASGGMLLSKDGKTLMAYPTASGNVTVSTVISIDYGAFLGCTSLTSVSFPAVTSIGSFAFEGCTSLTSVSFPAATSISSPAFYGCTSLTTADFPLVTFIGASAFSGCTNLTTADFPLVTDIDHSAFYGCTGLTTVNAPLATFIYVNAFGSTGSAALTITLGETPPATVGRDMFRNVSVTKNVTVRVPSSAVSSYDTAWQKAFKGIGNTGETGSVNTYINLTIQGY